MKFCQLNKGDIIIYSSLRPNEMGLKRLTVKKIKDNKNIYNQYYDYCRIWFEESDITISVPPCSDYHVSKAHKFVVFIESAGHFSNFFQDLGSRLGSILSITTLKKDKLQKEINTRTNNITALGKQLEDKPLLVVDKLCPGVDYYIGHIGSAKIMKVRIKAVRISAGWIQFDNDIFISIPKNVEQEVWFSFHNRYVSTNKNALVRFLIEKEIKKLSFIKRKYEASEYREIELSEIYSEISNEYEEEFRD